MRPVLFLVLTAKLGIIVADSITPLKLVEKGLRKDLLAMIITVTFPVEFVVAIMVGAGARGKPLNIVCFNFFVNST